MEDLAKDLLLNYVGSQLPNIKTHPVNTWSDLLPRFNWGGGSSYQLPEYKKSQPKKRRATSTRINMDGSSTKTSTFKKKRKKKRRKKKSTKAVIKQLKKTIPPKSHKTFRDFQTLVLLNTAPNTNRVYQLNPVLISTIDSQIGQLTAVDSSSNYDYRTENTKVQFSWFYKLMCKNNATGNIEIEYCFYKCKDDGNEGVITNMLKSLDDRGYTGLPVFNGPQASTATQSAQPAFTEFGATTPYHVPRFSGRELLRKWKPMGKVQKAVVGPGDSFNIVNSGKFTYAPEDLDNSSVVYQKGHSVQLMLSVRGGLSHDNTNKLLIGRDFYQLDCEEQIQNHITYNNPKGLNEVVYSDTLTDVNFSIPVHADNFVSAIEQVLR